MATPPAWSSIACWFAPARRDCRWDEIQEKIGVPGSTLSHHLHRLVANGLVTQERRGTVLVCRADYDAMRGLIGFLLDECCADEKQAAGRADAEPAT